MDPILTSETLSPTSYQVAIRDHLKDRQRELWDWFASDALRGELCEAVRLDLLKTTYRIEASENPALYELAAEASRVLGFEVPVTVFYQSQGSVETNASLAYLPGEAHVVFHGPLAETLTRGELLATIGHELSHFLLYEGWDHEFLHVARILGALTRDPSCEPPHEASARLFSLHNELFCDRGACLVVGDAAVAIAALLKIETGLREVSVASYLRQAEELFSKGNVQAAGISHPESFIRARALYLWSERGAAAQAEIRRMIEGPLEFDTMDLVERRHLEAWTRGLLDAIFAHPSMRTEATLAHARLFFEDYSVSEEPAGVSRLPSIPEDLLAALDRAADRDGSRGLQHYICYFLLDFAVVDRDLGEVSLAALSLLARELNCEERFGQIAAKELGMRKKTLTRIQADAEDILAAAASRGGN